MSGALQAVFQNQRSFGTPPGQDAYITAGTFSWVAPAGVTKVSVVAIGGGAAGGGGLGYTNNITVIPANSYTVVVGSGLSVAYCPVGTGTAGTSYFSATCVVAGYGGNQQGVSSGAGGSYTGTGGGSGGNSNSGFSAGGSGGYSGNGGNGVTSGSGAAGSGGGGGSGGPRGSGVCGPSGCYYLTSQAAHGAGGGTGLLGQGSNGSGGASGAPASPNTSYGGGGGGGGSSGGNGTAGGNSSAFSAGAGGSGGAYGGGGGQAGFQETYSLPCLCLLSQSQGTAGPGSKGAVRIIWPGCARSFPSTRTADE